MLTKAKIGLFYTVHRLCSDGRHSKMEMSMLSGIILSLVIMAGEAEAGTRTDAFVNKEVGGATTPVLSVYTSSPLTLPGSEGPNSLSFTTFGLVMPGWAEVYGGLAYSPFSWAEVSASVGVETVQDAPWRVAGSLYMNPGRFTVLGIGEYGGSGLWYKGVLTYSLPLADDQIAVGAMSQAFLGHGPRVELNLKWASFYGAPLWTADTMTIHTGIGKYW